MSEPIAVNGHKVAEPYGLEAAPFLNTERAALVHRMRVEENYTWRGVAEDCAATCYLFRRGLVPAVGELKLWNSSRRGSSRKA
ncbi:MAG: hypothetical protein M3021_06835 [Actinomycetota bacterium]|nr:hypothetical protein [Actinomycetota bacterium]